MSTEKRLLDIKTKVASAQQEETRATILRESALRDRTKALARLKEEFNVDSLEKAVKLLAKKEKEHDVTLADLEKALDALGQ